jgi:hypothetical protein
MNNITQEINDQSFNANVPPTIRSINEIISKCLKENLDSKSPLYVLR